MGLGLSRGGAVDRHALLRGSALLGNPVGSAALEMTVGGGRFRVTTTTRIAMTGADLNASLNGTRLETGATYVMKADDVLNVGAASGGVYGYLHFAGGLTTDEELGGRGRHGIGGLGLDMSDKDVLPLGIDPEPKAAPMRLNAPAGNRQPIRVIPGPQTDLFPEDVLAVFEATTFTRSPKGNRQGVKMDFEGRPFATDAQLGQVSDFISEGDIQMTGDGTPFVLLAECQTMGGYPRIGTVIPMDLPRVAQALPGEELKFAFATLADVENTWKSDEDLYREFRKARLPRTRDPREMGDLLSYELINRPDPDVTG
ncbi:MAG: biotin-dependent carboxyltransferase family protein [Boseongicola sp.]|nr:biotin-dependent carboxyltransferase family protein [Boseongicola sp.]